VWIGDGLCVGENHVFLNAFVVHYADSALTCWEICNLDVGLCYGFNEIDPSNVCFIYGPEQIKDSVICDVSNGFQCTQSPGISGPLIGTRQFGTTSYCVQNYSKVFFCNFDVFSAKNTKYAHPMSRKLPKIVTSSIVR
jgi:hypothetical protein